MPIGPILRAMLKNRVRFGLLALEVALTLAIVVNCVTAIQRARGELARASGFADDELIQVVSRPYEPSLRDRARAVAVLDSDLRAIRALPGVAAATDTRFLPWQGGGSSGEVKPVGAPREAYVRTQQYAADEATLDALDARVVAGRAFTREGLEHDDAALVELFASPRERGADGAPKTRFVQEVVISRALAERLFGAEPAVGKRVEDHDLDQYSIIGVIDEFYQPYQWDIGSYGMFFAARTVGGDGGTTYLVRAEKGHREEVARAIESTVLGVHGGRNVSLRTITDIRARFESTTRLLVDVLAGVLVLLVFVTSLGIVGLTSFSVAERTRQIGIRRALGARRSDVVLHFVIESAIVAVVGLVVGSGLAIALNVALVSALGAARLAPGSLLTGAAVLAVASVGAALAPALRAARVAPTIATRNV